MDFSTAMAKASWILEATPDGSSLHETHRRHHGCVRQILTNHSMLSVGIILVK